MNKTIVNCFRILAIPFLTMIATTGWAQDKLYANEFPLGDVTLLDGPLKHARDLNIKTLLKYDCDRLLAPTAKRPDCSLRRKPIPTGTDSTDTWEATT